MKNRSARGDTLPRSALSCKLLWSSSRSRSFVSAWLPILPGGRQPISWYTSCCGGVLAPVVLPSPPGSRGPRTGYSFLSRHPVVDGCPPESLSCVPSFRARCRRGRPCSASQAPPWLSAGPEANPRRRCSGAGNLRLRIQGLSERYGALA
jgi:hypothetical protein